MRLKINRNIFWYYVHKTKFPECVNAIIFSSFMSSEGNKSISVWVTCSISQFPKQTQTLQYDEVPLPLPFFSHIRKTDYFHLLVEFRNYFGEPSKHERTERNNQDTELSPMNSFWWTWPGDPTTEAFRRHQQTPFFDRFTDPPLPSLVYFP